MSRAPRHRRAVFSGRRPALGAGLAVAFIVPALIAVPASAAETAVPAAVPAPAAVPPVDAPDEATAIQLARRWGRPIEVLSARKPSAETFAQPDGTMRDRVYASPTRVLQGSTWVPINTNLKPAGGAIVPTATTLDVRFSDGGTEPMVTVTKDGKSLSISWLPVLPDGSPAPGGVGTLPPPTVSGSTAKYAEVLRGVDLLLTAKPDSFSEVLVVKDRTAARSAALAQLRFNIQMRGVALRQDATGFISVADPQGNPVFGSDGARMWGAPQKINPPDAIPGSPGEPSIPSPPADPEPSEQADVPVRASQSAIEVVPSQQLLTSLDTKFPVYIDPGFNGGTEIWTHVSRKNPAKSYWSDSNRDTMRVGQVWGGSSDDDWRTLVQFDVTKLKGSTIKRANVIVNVQHSADCAPSPFQLWQTNAISKSSAVTWNSTKGKWWKVLGEVKATANKSSCPKGNDEVKFSQAAVKTAFQTAATNKNGTITFAFRAKSESDTYQWKKLKPGSTYLDVEYNHTPGKPTSIGFSPCNTKTCTQPVLTYSKQPALQMAVDDPNGGTLRYEYEVYASNKTTLKIKSDKVVTGVAVKSVRKWTLSKIIGEGQFYWRGRGCDTYICGAYSDWYGFTIDSTNPKNPTVSSTLYNAVDWNGGPGVPGTFVFRPGGGSTDGVKSYSYTLNDGPATTVPAAADGTLTRIIAPVKDMVNTLKVTAMDAANNISGGVEYPFLVRPIGESWHWGLDEGRGTVAASQPVNNQPVTVAGTGIGWSDTGFHGTAGYATFAGGGELTTTAPVLRTSSAAGFTVAAAVYLPGPVPEDGDDTDPGEPGEPEPGTGDDPEEGGTPTNEEQPADPSLLPATNLTATSQEGNTTAAFRLGYRTDLDVTGDGVAEPAWCFTVKTQDVLDAPAFNACTNQYLLVGEWVHLTGVMDPAAAGGQGQLRLYVNGTPDQLGVEAVTPGKLTWEAGKKFMIGSRAGGTTPTERWVGGIDEVYAVPRIWTPEQINAAAISVTG